MDYFGTDADDVIDQPLQAIPDGTAIHAGKGNDKITFGNANVDGGAGNDTLDFRGGWGAAVYWSAQQGVTVDLATGSASDGLGGTDTLLGVMNVHATRFDDVLIGNSGDNGFMGLGGNDTVVGGGGYDSFAYMGVPSTAATISYDRGTDTFTIVKRFPNGDHGTDKLTGISRISFSGPGSDERIFYPDHFSQRGGFVLEHASSYVPIPANAWVASIKMGDFNGDGAMDLAVSSSVGTGTAPAPVIFMLGNGGGTFSDGTPVVTGQDTLLLDGSGRTLVADFNNDGISDFMYFNSGDDAPPFAGGINRLFVSAAGTGLLTPTSTDAFPILQFSHGGSAGDINGDGFTDLLVNTLSHGNDLYLNNGNGGLQHHAELMPRPVNETGALITYTQSGLIDIDDDGDLDAVLGRWPASPNSVVLFNDAHGDFSKAAPVALPRSPLANDAIVDIRSIDLNGDMLPDLMLAVADGTYQTGYIQLLVNMGHGEFRDETESRLPAAVQATFGSGGWIFSLESVDLNRDGAPDIVVTSASPTKVKSQALMNQGAGVFSVGWNLDGRAVAIDANDDGMTDIATLDERQIYLSRNVMENGHIYKANFEGGRLAGSDQADAFTGSKRQDEMLGRAGDDRFEGRGGNDRIDGGAGIDTASYAGSSKAYTITRDGDDVLVMDTRPGGNGSDSLTGIERLVFDDTAIALDIAGHGGQAYRIYQAALNRTPDAAGLGFWISMLDRGLSVDAMAASVMDSPEFQAAYSGITGSADLIGRFYHNILGRPPEQAGIDFWTGVIDRGAASIAQVLAAISESAENQSGLAATIGDGFPFQPYG